MFGQTDVKIMYGSFLFLLVHDVTDGAEHSNWIAKLVTICRDITHEKEQEYLILSLHASA